MVIDVNSTPIGIPSLMYGWRRKIYSVQTAQLWSSTAVKQHGWEVALGQGLSLARQLCSALVCSTCSGPATLFCSCACLLPSALVRHLQYFSSSQETVFSVWWKGEVHSQRQRGAHICGHESLPLVPDWSILMQMRIPNPHSLVGPKGTVLIDQNGAVMIGQWRCWCRDTAAQLQLNREKPQSYCLKHNSRNSFIRAGSDDRNTVQAAAQCGRQSA